MVREARGKGLGARGKDGLKDRRSCPLSHTLSLTPHPCRSGYTLAELMISVAVLGVIFALAPRALLDTYNFFRMSMVRAEIQRDARASLDLMNRELRQARAASVIVDRLSSSQPPYSRATFYTISNSTMSFWQDGNRLRMYETSRATRTVAENLRYVAFTYGESPNESILSVSVTFEKSLYAGKSKALQMAVEKVRIMNN
ncbi:MAG: PulJ/GspJ family protein [Elusimicrobiota bacterium]